MVYHYRTVKCPNCGCVADKTRTVDSQELKGSPFRVCRHCNEVYFDPDYKEAAISIYNDKGGSPNIWSFIWVVLSNVFAVFFLVQGAKEGFRDLGAGWIAILVFLGLAILFDVGFYRVIRNRIHANEYHQKSLDTLEGRTGELTGELAASMERMSNKAYLDALVAHGVVVPSYFYERLTGKETSNFIIPNEVSTIDNSAVQQISEEVDESRGDVVTRQKEQTYTLIRPQKMNFCRNCGAHLEENAKYCSNCGQKLEDFYYINQ